VPAETHPPLDAAQANEEIAELRRKLARLGAVNMDALQELNDLAAAKRALEEIIAKINDDSRKLFTETFNAIRTNFTFCSLMDIPPSRQVVDHQAAYKARRLRTSPRWRPGVPVDFGGVPGAWGGRTCNEL
jgi:hypothetical protein